MLQKLLISAVLLAITSVAVASDWVHLTDTSDNTEMSVDLASQVRSGQYAKAWVRITLLKPQANYNGSGQKLKAIKVLWIFNCDQKTSAVGTSIFIDVKGENIGAGDPGSPNLFSDVAPDSTGGTVMDSACMQEKRSELGDSRAQNAYGDIWQFGAPAR